MAARKYSFVFYGALVVAMAATYGVWRVIEATKAGSRIATASVVVAAVDIPEGTPIDRLSLSVNQWPASTIPVGAYSRVDSVIGRISRVSIFKGEPIVPGRLAPEGTSAGLETKITPGKRALGVRINDVSGISGMILPNSRVDILLTANPTGTSLDRTTKLFMANMRVLAMGAQVQRGDDGRPIQTTVATLEVTPEEGERLTLAQAQGQIQLMLRGYGDPDSIDTDGARARDLVVRPPSRPTRPAPSRPAPAPAPAPVQEKQEPPPPAAPPRPARPESLRVEVIRGTQRTDVMIKKDSVRRDTIPPPARPFDR